MRLTLQEKHAIKTRDQMGTWLAVKDHLAPEFRYGDPTAAMSDGTWRDTYDRQQHLIRRVMPRYHRHDWMPWWKGDEDERAD